jgi:hypothetical protein
MPPLPQLKRQDTNNQQARTRETANTSCRVPYRSVLKPRRAGNLAPRPSLDPNCQFERWPLLSLHQHRGVRFGDTEFSRKDALRDCFVFKISVQHEFGFPQKTFACQTNCFLSENFSLSLFQMTARPDYIRA